jgi:hypothetical protein
MNPSREPLTWLRNVFPRSSASDNKARVIISHHILSPCALCALTWFIPPAPYEPDLVLDTHADQNLVWSLDPESGIATLRPVGTNQ